MSYKCSFEPIPHKFPIGPTIHFKWTTLLSLFSPALLTFLDPTETLISFLNYFQIQQNLHRADVLGPLYRSRCVRRDGKRTKAEADLAAESLIQQSETALREGGSSADLDMVLEMALEAERFNFQEAGAICETWFSRHVGIGDHWRKPNDMTIC
jgi:hypothetical protein